MNKKQIVSHLKSDIYCRLGTGRLGIGIFAIKDIPRGTDIFKSSKRIYVKVSREEIEKEKIDDGVLKMLEDFFVEREGFFYIPKNGFSDVDISFYLNHSYSPNVKFDEENDAIISLRDIKKGEELFSDYGTYDKEWMEKNKKIIK